MASDEINKNLDNYIKILLKKYKKNTLPATAIGAEYLSYKKTDYSGPPPDKNSIAKKLLEKLNQLGGVGKKINNNVVGCCCEVRASNKILSKSINLPPNKITFTNAIRPRTGQIVKRCKNCEEVFGHE